MVKEAENASTDGSFPWLKHLASPWWESRWFAYLLLFLAALPLIWPANPPLVDYPGHLGRYRVEMGLDSSPWLHRYYSFDWMLIGNLGVDLLIIPLSKIFGLELAGKLIVLAIPVLTVAGALAIAREVHGRVPPQIALVVPLAYGYPFQFGFINSCLSVALAFLMAALWMRLGRLGKLRLRAGLFVVLSCLLWICHTVGWGVLGILCGAAELFAPERKGQRFFRRCVGTVLACIPLLPPVLLMWLWRSGDVSGRTIDSFNWVIKWRWVYSAVREQNETWDILSIAIIALGTLLGWMRWRDRISGRMALASLALLGAFIAMPRIVIGSAYADMRLVPIWMMAMVIAIAPYRPTRWAQAIAILTLLFVTGRQVATTVVYGLYHLAHSRQLAALDAVPMGARILVLVGKPCGMGWYSTRLEHIGSLAIVRKDAFVNDQWVLAGAQLLNIKHKAAAPYTHDPSQMVPARTPCRLEPQYPVTYTLEHFPRAAFDFVWMMNLPMKYWPVERGLVPVHRTSNGILYRVVHGENTQ